MFLSIYSSYEKNVWLRNKKIKLKYPQLSCHSEKDAIEKKLQNYKIREIYFLIVSINP